MGMDSNDAQKSDKMKALDYCSESAEIEGKKMKYRARMTKAFEAQNKDWGNIA